MIHTHHDSAAAEGADADNIDGHCDRCAKDLNFLAYAVGAAILVGALLISAALFYDFKLALKHMDDAAAHADDNQASLLRHLDDNSASLAAALGGKGPAVAAPGGPSAAPGAPVKISLKSGTLYLGNANAKVTVVEFADYQCPFCEQFYKNTWPELKSKYVDTGKIKFVYQDFAFLGPDSNTAAEASHCAADQNKFWQYHDYLFSHQGQEGSAWATAVHQKEFAAAVGLNTGQFNQCLDSGKYKQEVLDETASGRSYGVSGTPTVFVNGAPIVGAQPVTSFEQAIDAALKK